MRSALAVLSVVMIWHGHDRGREDAGWFCVVANDLSMVIGKACAEVVYEPSPWTCGQPDLDPCNCAGPGHGRATVVAYGEAGGADELPLTVRRAAARFAEVNGAPWAKERSIRTRYAGERLVLPPSKSCGRRDTS